jgi:N-acetylmuramoyl-L-alanine amidase
MTSCINNALIIDQNHLSSNCNQRISSLVLHYTALNFEKSLQVLTDPKTQVSAHYLVPEKNTAKERKVLQLVKENERAWHAGISHWQRRSNLNDTSIGIEIVNLGYTDNEDGRIWYSFTDYQIETIIELAKTIIERYQIHPTCVVGHSDIAPGRKVDPGPFFPWKKLYENGIGAWFDEKELVITQNIEINIRKLQENLQRYGYAIEITGKFDEQTRTILQAFQMHFRTDDYSGSPDAETFAILENLIQKYF